MLRANYFGRGIALGTHAQSDEYSSAESSVPADAVSLVLPTAAPSINCPEQVCDDDPNYRADLHRSWYFGSQRKVVLGAGVLAAFGLAVLTCVFWRPEGERATTQAVEPMAGAQPIAQLPAPTSAPVVASALAWPDLPASLTAAPARPTEESVSRHAGSASQKRDVVFLQRSSVNIRSTPSANGIVLGTAPKGARFKVTKRDGDWSQIESDRFNGWINSQYLSPNLPR